MTNWQVIDMIAAVILHDGNRASTMSAFPRLAILLLTTFGLLACESMYFGAMEQVGYHKRDILVERVEDVQESQTEAKEQFLSALDQFQQLVTINDQELLRVYKTLNNEFEESKSSAELVSERINAVESVSEALFEEWQDELEQYTNIKLKRESQQKLSSTRQKYTQLMKSMRKAESRMQPVLNAMHDQVLYLKHNLNARAIDSLQGELKSIEQDVSRLIKDMEKSIAESEAFIKSINQG